jgi:multicomponent K+:H+ antiporter subunit E
MTVLRNIMPAPLLSASLVGMWLVLARSTSPGQIVLGLSLGLIVPHLTRELRPAGVRVRRPLLVVRFIGRVGYDVLASNLAVAWGIATLHWSRPRARFVIIPLELRDPVGLAALAMITTVVPGTVWSELALDRSKLMLHVWDVGEEQAFIAHFKARYEQPLREIFE